VKIYFLDRIYNRSKMTENEKPRKIFGTYNGAV
jgi:hypothetical protein